MVRISSIVEDGELKITCIGCGRWGAFIAWYLQERGHDVTLYGREHSAHMQALLQDRRNEYLTLPKSLLLSTDLSCVDNADIIVISINAQGFRALAAQLAEHGIQNKIIVLCMKGIEIGSGKRLSEIAAETLHPSNRTAVWLGPGHVQEFLRGIPNCMVIDSTDDSLKHDLVAAFSGGQIRFYYGQDIIGNEIGAAAKNVIGIAAGTLDGLSLSSLKGALMSRGTREVARLIVAMGGNELSAYGLCHLGDYEATVFSKYSHNRRFGEAFVRGEAYHELAEGYYTVRAIEELSSRYQVEMPICHTVYRLLYQEEDNPEALMNDLFGRSLKNEFWK